MNTPRSGFGPYRCPAAASPRPCSDNLRVHDHAPDRLSLTQADVRELDRGSLGGLVTSVDRAHHRPSEGPEHRLGRRGRSPVRTESERGVFMTTDGGKTWTKTLYVNPDTGATELIIDPSNPNNLWAATYEHRRTAWGYVGGGPGSGMHQSTDGGKTWKKVDRQRPAARHDGPHRAGHLQDAAERDLRADRSGAGQGNRPRGSSTRPAAARGRGRRQARRGAARRRAGGGRGRRRRAAGGGGGAAAAARSAVERHLAIGRQGQDLAVHVATRTSGRCTSARFASTRTTRTSSTSAA